MSSARHRDSTAPNFDRIARPYRWLEYLSFGRLLEQTRFYFLPRVAGRRNALVLGDGDGRFLSRLLQQDATLHATAVDASAAMLQLLNSRCEAADGRLTLIREDIRRFSPAATDSFDLIVSHFFLDCLSEEEIVALETRLHTHLLPDGEWLISEFAEPSNALRLPARILVRLLYAAFAVLTGLRISRLPDYRRILKTSGWQCIAEKQFAAGLLVTELWKLTSVKPEMHQNLRDSAERDREFSNVTIV